MVPLHRNIIKLILVILFVNITAKKTKYKCPIGFSLAYNKYDEDNPVCYRRKGPESFGDKFKDCAGNLYTTKLYHSLNFTEPNLVLWTDYKSLYPGGPFVDQSYTKSTGEVLITTFDVKYDTSLGLDEEFCVIIDPVTNFTATRCNEQHYRYCFVRPYVKVDEMTRDGCKDLKDFYRFYSPRPTCLAALTGVNGGTVRANWRQAKELCSKKGGALLNRGWRYANYPGLSSNTNPMFPLGIILSPDNSSIRYDITSEDGVIPESEWYFEKKILPSDNSLGAIRDDFWYMVNSTYRFYDVICERAVLLRPVSMNVSVEADNKIILRLNESVHNDNVYCFTDSATFYPTLVSVRFDIVTHYYVLKPIADGYYWCILIDSINHIVSESNKALFVREKQSLVNYYAIKIHLDNSYNFEYLEKFYKDWKNKLEEYIFFRSHYVRVFGELELGDKYETEEKLKSFKASHPALKWKDVEPINRIKIKKLYLDGKTALVHVQLNPEMLAVGPGKWEDLEILYMKPVYYCKAFDSVPMLPLGSTYNSSGCRTHSCVGDFSEGVQWVTTAAEGCSTFYPTTRETNVRVYDFMPTVRSPTPAETTTQEFFNQTESDCSSEEQIIETTQYKPIRPSPTPQPPIIDNTTPITDNNTVATEATVPTEMMTPTEVETVTSEIISVTTVTLPWITSTTQPTETLPSSTETVSTGIPVITTLPPDEQLQQVMENLENLLQDESSHVSVQDVENTFDQVDGLLDNQGDLEIPGTFLHLLDELGARVDLNGSGHATAVRSNIALVLADADPSSPVRGLRIAARDDPAFTADAFEIISDEVNDTHLATNTSEAVVQLPDSVANSTRRISFMVFRTDRAFKNNPQHQVYSVNSRVLSIKVENLTKFEDGEVIDIHLNPIQEEADRNETRACVYWHFFEDGTGFWSREGCKLIRSVEEGMLDTCRCDHLTHFAEVLIPRTSFSNRQEHVLEILSIIGCFISIFGLIIIGLTAALFRAWRRDYSNKIWLQLCIAIFMLMICFLVTALSHFEIYDIPCMLIGVLLHYSTLASFCWMLVAAVLSYRRLVIVFTRDASHKLLRACAFSWGFPFLVIGILLSVDPHSYSRRFDEKSPSGSFCYPSGIALYITIYGPIAITLLANWALFILIVRSVFASRNIQRHGDSNEALRCASVSCLLVFLFGLPWVLGLFAFNIVAAYLFTLTATLQGFVLFLFFVLGNKKTRDMWLNKLKIKQTRKIPVTSSTYTHRSVSNGNRPGVAAIEANSQKPRSLSSSDNSRFS